eukprot:1176644-Prorocentrum_minimum.AAC.1
MIRDGVGRGAHPQGPLQLQQQAAQRVLRLAAAGGPLPPPPRRPQRVARPLLVRPPLAAQRLPPSPPGYPVSGVAHTISMIIATFANTAENTADLTYTRTACTYGKNAGVKPSIAGAATLCERGAAPAYGLLANYYVFRVRVRVSRNWAYRQTERVGRPDPPVCGNFIYVVPVSRGVEPSTSGHVRGV